METRSHHSTTSGEGWVGALCHPKNSKKETLSRPIEKLYPLEVLAEEDLQDSKEKIKNPEEIRSTSEKRAQRAAAQRAALKINELGKLSSLEY